jgi:hypothetical protein
MEDVMKPRRIARWAPVFDKTVSRRRVILWSFLAGLPLGCGGQEAMAGKRGRKAKQKIRRNEFGCVSVGSFCRNDAQCCTGLCDGKKGKRRCSGHGAGTCNQEAEGVCQSLNPISTACNNRADCACFRTTGDSSVCAELFCVRPGCSECAVCRSDADCVALGLPPGAACAAVAEGLCAGVCETGMACLLPCGLEPPPPSS